MTPLMPAARWCWMLLITGIILGVSLSRESLAYTIEAEIMNPNAMIFPVGGMLPGNLSTADDVDFQSIATIFRMRVTDSDTTDPDTLILMVRLEVAGGDPIFTVSSTPISVPLVLCPLGWQRNDQLATVGPLHIGEGDDVNANQVLPYVDGGNLADNLYVLTVLLADPSMTSEDWASAENENYGIKSATTRVRNPSQVELVQPQFRDEVFSNPIFTWLFPRNPSVYFRLELASGDPDDDPSTALDFANESSLFVDTTFSAGFAASGEQTTYGYQGTGGERPLIPGRTYFWRVTAIAPTMFYQDSVFIECTPSRFEYGSLPEIEILEPADDVTFESKDPEFLWSYPQRPELSFKIEIVKGNFLTGDKYAEIEIDGGAGGQFSYTYGTSFNDLQLDPGTYEWRITATSIIEGISVSVESPIRSFSYEPRLELVWPVGSPRLILGCLYTFSWRYPQHIPVSQFGIVLFKDEEGGLDAFKTWNAGGNERRLHWDEMLPAGSYHWHVIANHPRGGNIQSDEGYFLIPYPDIMLVRPPDNGSVYTQTPTFEWKWDPSDPSIPTRGEFDIIVKTVDDETEIASVTVNDVGSWTYEGDSLDVDREYSWTLKTEVSYPGAWWESERTRTFFYRSDIQVPELILDSPEDGATVTEINPELRWSFPQLPDGFELTFELTLTQTEGENLASQTFTRSGANRSYILENLEPNSVYEWGIIATYTPPQGLVQLVESETSTFNYEPEDELPWDDDSPQANLLNALSGLIPAEMIDLIVESLRSGYLEIDAIRVDGDAVDLEALLAILGQDNIEIVLINVGQ